MVLVALMGALLVTAAVIVVTWPLLNPFARRSSIADVQLEAATGKASYARGEPVDISVALVNRGPTPVALHANTSCPGYFTVDGQDGTHYDSRVDMLCLPGASEVVIPPGAALRSNVTWSQRDEAGGPVPVPAWYLVFVWFEFVEGNLANVTGPVIIGLEVSLVEHLQAEAGTDKATYAQGETVRIAVSLTNTADWPLLVTSGLSCGWFFQVEDLGGDVVFDVGRHQFCPSPLTFVRLDPGESYQDVTEWDQRDDAGDLVPAPATYVIRVVFVGSSQATATIAVA